MGRKIRKCQFYWPNQLILLQVLCTFIGLLPFIVTEQSNQTVNHDARIAEAKANLLKMIQKETYQLHGFDEFATIPITYPLDICLMEVSGQLYAVCLALKDSQNRKDTVLKVLKKVPEDPRNQLFDYVQIFAYETRSALSIDCISMGTEGYIAVVNEITSDHYDDASDASPIFELKNDQIVPVQYFAQARQNRMHFLKHHDELLMWQTFQSGAQPNHKSRCPILKWTESTFNEIDHIPCMNARRIEPFSIDHRIYVAVANYMDEHQNIETHSMIFHYDIDTHKFNLTQKIKTFGAVDIKHVQIEDNHFLFVANTFQVHASDTVTSNAVVYQFEHSKFVPIQIIPFDDQITQFLPYLGEKKEFVLLVSLKEGTTKTYQYDGFTFFETPITFTGGSLGRGVARMRTFNLNNNFLVLVVANSEMYHDATNLFRIKFTVTMDYDFTKAFEMFDNWYAGIQEKLKTDRAVEMFQEIEALQPPPGFGNMILENTKVNVIYTETLSSTAIPIDFNKLKKYMHKAEEILTKDVVRRPKRLNDSMLQNDMNSTLFEEADLMDEWQEMPKTLHVDELIVSESFFAERINGHNVEDLLHTDIDLVLNTLAVDDLIIVNNTDDFEAIEAKLLENDKRMKRDTSADPTVPLDLNNVIVKGRINGIDFNYLLENALKTDVPNQVLESKVTIGTLTADSLVTADGKLSELAIANIAHTNANEVLIRQPIRFTKNLDVNRLKVLQRLNQILIENGKMDVLFKRSKQVQVIKGLKEFRSIELLNPIILQGKINVTSPMVERIRPIVTINEDLELQGDFQFLGNVTIQNFLQAQNMYGRSLRNSAMQVLEDGLRLDEPVVDMDLVFTQPIRVEEIRPQSRINGVPLESLIQRGSSEVHFITAPKTFIGDLFVVGGLDAAEINGVNLQVLNNTMLKRSGKNQVISGNIQFSKITAKKIHANEIILGKTPMDRLLTFDTDQVINANVTVHGNVFVTNDANVTVNHLFMNGTVFGVDLPALIDDCYFNSPNESIIITQPKWFQNITFDRLVVESDFWQVGLTTAEIQQHLEDLKTGITITGPVTFDSDFSINNLTVIGTVNDIPGQIFGRNWLRTEGAQTFTVPQNFTDVTFNDNIQLYGLLNGHDLGQLVADTVSRNEPVRLNEVMFDNVIFKKSLNIGGKLSGIQIPNDLIVSQSDSLQNFNEEVNFASNVEIRGTLSIEDKLNHFNVAKMCELFDATSDSWVNLTINGDVIFTQSPNVVYLNSEPFEHLRATTWMAFENNVTFASSVQFEDVIFEQPITTSGLVNDIDLHELNDRYLSLSKPQTVTTPLHFKGRVYYRDSFEVDTLSLDGLIKVPNSDITLNITDFYQNVLKTTTDTQYIRGPWTFNEIRILGDLMSTKINDLNLASDVARWDSPSTNIITAPKHFESLSIGHLTCPAGCTLQGIDMDEWMQKSVMIGLNNTIQGTVYANDPVISHIEVLGRVNGLRFDSQNILLKSVPQTIRGSLTIGNQSNPESINSLTFDNILVNFINDKNVSEFFENLVLRNDRGKLDVGEIFTNIEFMDRLNIDDLDITSEFNNINVNQMAALSDSNNNIEQFRLATNELDRFVERLAKQEKFKHFDGMITRQWFSSDLHALRKLSGYDFELVALNNSNIQFYEWNVTQMTLQESNIPSTLSENMDIIDLTVLQVDLMHLLVIQMHNFTSGKYVHQFYDHSHDLQQPKLVLEIAQDEQMIMEPIHLNRQQCFIFYRKFNATHYDVHCIDVIDSESQQLTVQQYDSVNASEIYKIISRYENAMILWFINGEIESRWYDTQNHFEYSVRSQFDNVTSVAADQFGDKAFVAISTHFEPLNRTNIIEAMIHIYRAGENRAHLEHYSNIKFANTVIVQCEFSKLSDVQAILVVVVRNAAEELLQIYQDKGIDGFQQLKQYELPLKVAIQSNFYAQVAPERRFSLIESKDGILSFIAVHFNHGMSFLECIYI